MANQRPIRTPRNPRWRRGRFTPRGRPARWLDASFQNSGDQCGIELPFAVECEPTTPAELLVGELDLDWLDRNDARIDRIVGTISWFEEASNTGSQPRGTVVRFGILQTEDTDRLYQTIDLFDSESLEQFEWMWLQQFSFNNNSYIFNDQDPDTFVRSASVDIPLDIRTRRKIGHKDSIVLYVQRRLIGLPSASESHVVRYVHQLRCIART